MERSVSILGSIISKVFHHSDAPAEPASAPATPQASVEGPAANTAPASPSAEADATAAAQPVDVAEILDGLDQSEHEKLDWRHSIVDLMKLLKLDSSHSARIELAHELHYEGNTEDSATMNIWLHAQVMQKLAENGGKVPDELTKY
jgi:hypothetical protein